MTRTFFASFVLLLCMPTNWVLAVGLVDEPYAVYVIEDGYTRCGPSDEFYRTERISDGDTLEVYIETDDGWLGIRPTDSSFCWIPADQVEMSENGVQGTITSSQAVAWIGTNLGRARKYRWQVKFEIGESITVIGKTDRETATGEPETWYRIVPPPGEFRWVHDSQVVADKDMLAKLKQSQRERRIASSDGLQDSGKPKPFDMAAARAHAARTGHGDTPAEPIEQVGYRQEIPTRPIESSLHVDDRVRVREIQKPRSTELDTNSPWVQSTRPPAVNENANVQPGRGLSSRWAADQSGSVLRSMQLEFARLMAEGASANRLEALKMRAEIMTTSATNPSDQEKARQLVGRIVKFQGLTRSNATSVPMAQDTYDRQGWLQKVYSERPNAPPYALTDREGKTVAYVTPAMGMNIRRYMNQEVGIIGKPSYLTGIDTPHFVAERVVSLPR